MVHVGKRNSVKLSPSHYQAVSGCLEGGSRRCSKERSLSQTLKYDQAIHPYCERQPQHDARRWRCRSDRINAGLLAGLLEVLPRFQVLTGRWDKEKTRVDN